MMTLIGHELRLLLRQRLSLLSLGLLALLTLASLGAGMAEVARQRAAIAAIPAAQAEDIAAVADYVARTKDAGSAAYYSFHPTWDAPGPLAFVMAPLTIGLCLLVAVGIYRFVEQPMTDWLRSKLLTPRSHAIGAPLPGR